MGQILRGAKIVDQRYLVAVPETASDPEATLDELDDRFVASGHDALSFDDEEPRFGSNGEPPPLEPRVDWEQVRAEAQVLIDQASADGEALLQDAARRAREMVSGAQARAGEIADQARTEGREDGMTAGRAAAHAELSEAIASMYELIEAVRVQRRSVIESAEPELVALAMAVAERIVHEAISVDPKVVVENVRHALTRLIGREVVTLRVNPADIETIRQHRDGIASSGDVEHLRVVEDQRVDRGGVVIETDAGTIDAKIATQLREARRTLQNGDVIGQAS